MATLPPIEVLCPSVPVSSQALIIRFPGGAELQVQSPSQNPDAFELSKQLLAQGSAGLAPLQPVFNILDVALASFECIKAIPEAITSLDPQGLIDCIPDLAEKADKLLSLVPQLSVPLMILDFIDAILLLLDGVIDRLEAILVSTIRIAEARQIAEDENLDALLEIAICSEDQIEASVLSLGESLKVINTLIGMLNIFMELAGLDPIPSFAELGPDAQEALGKVKEIVGLLKDIRKLIPA